MIFMEKNFYVREASPKVAQAPRLRSERFSASMKNKQSPTLSAFAGGTPALH
jgi:hypothetical protein